MLMLPRRNDYLLPAAVHCPQDHLRMLFDAREKRYRCDLPGCFAAYTPELGYHRLDEPFDAHAREIFHAQAAVCVCEHSEAHQLYIDQFVPARKVRFWACPFRGCGYEVTQRMEKTSDGWRTCGSFEHSKPVKLRH